MVPRFDFCSGCLTSVSSIKLFCLVHQFGNGLIDFDIVLDVAGVELYQTIEDLDICRSLCLGMS